jgi:hypothetical protein
MRVYIGLISLEIGLTGRLTSRRKCLVPRLAARPLHFQGRLRSMDSVSRENRPNCLHSIPLNKYSFLTSKDSWSMMITPPSHCEIRQWLGIYTAFQMKSTRQRDNDSRCLLVVKQQQSHRSFWDLRALRVLPRRFSVNLDPNFCVCPCGGGGYSYWLICIFSLTPPQRRSDCP